jgi:hypothetical protein
MEHNPTFIFLYGEQWKFLSSVDRELRDGKMSSKVPAVHRIPRARLLTAHSRETSSALTSSD